MLQLNTLVRFMHSHSPARLSKFKKFLARGPKSVPTPTLCGCINPNLYLISSTNILYFTPIKTDCTHKQEGVLLTNIKNNISSNNLKH